MIIPSLGNNGPAGPRGSSILSGAGAPGAGTGQPGDFYIDTTVPPGTIYGPKVGAVWGAGTPLGGGGGGGLSYADLSNTANNTVNTNRPGGGWASPQKFDFSAITAAAFANVPKKLVVNLQTSMSINSVGAVIAKGVIQLWDDGAFDDQLIEVASGFYMTAGQGGQIIQNEFTVEVPVHGLIATSDFDGAATFNLWAEVAETNCTLSSIEMVLLGYYY